MMTVKLISNQTLSKMDAKKQKIDLRRVIINMLREAGVEEYDKNLPGYIAQIAEKTAQNALLEGEELAKSDNRSAMNKQDVKVLEKCNQAESLNQQEMEEFSQKINSKHLPAVNAKSGLPIPCEGAMTNTNFGLKRPAEEPLSVNVNMPWPSQNNFGSMSYPPTVQMGMAMNGGVHFVAPNQNKTKYYEVMQRINGSSKHDKYYVDCIKKMLLMRHQNNKN